MTSKEKDNTKGSFNNYVDKICYPILTPQSPRVDKHVHFTHYLPFVT